MELHEVLCACVVAFYFIGLGYCLEATCLQVVSERNGAYKEAVTKQLHAIMNAFFPEFAEQ